MEKLFKELLKEIKLIRRALERTADTDEAWNAHNFGEEKEMTEEEIKNYIL